MEVQAIIAAVVVGAAVWVWRSVGTRRALRLAEERQGLLNKETGAHGQSRALWAAVKDEAVRAIKEAGVAEEELYRAVAANTQLIEEVAELTEQLAAADGWKAKYEEERASRKVSEANYAALSGSFDARGKLLGQVEVQRNEARVNRDRLQEDYERLVRSRDELHASLLGLRKDVVERVTATISARGA